jgi:iron complex outermembrane receptor protein
VFSAKVALPFINFTGNPAYGPMFGTNVGFVVGSKPGIQPETAKNWSTGFDFTPHFIRGLQLSATYFSIDYRSQITSPPSFAALLTNATLAAQWAAYIHPVPANPGCTGPAQYNAEQQAFNNAIGIYGNPTPAQICSLNVWVDTRETNAASTTETGVDMSLNYRFSLGQEAFDINGLVTRAITQKVQSIAGAPILSNLGTIGYLVPWRGRGSLTWLHGPWVANLYMNYVGSYLNNQPTAGTPNQTVPAWTTFDASVLFDVGRLSSAKWAQRLRFTVSAQNLFDRDPPRVLTAGYTAFDAANANPLGRIVTLQVVKDF